MKTTDTNTGGSAFPSLNAEMTGIDSDGNERFSVEPSGGMTLRDYFAAKALSNISFTVKPYDVTREVAENCYKMADAMLAERVK